MKVCVLCHPSSANILQCTYGGVRICAGMMAGGIVGNIESNKLIRTQILPLSVVEAESTERQEMTERTKE